MKKNISDLLDTYGDPNIGLERGTPLSTERIKELTMRKIKEEAAPKTRHLTFPVLIAAAIIVTLAVSVFAAENAVTWFQHFFTDEYGTELSQEQIAYIEENALPINESKTVSGYTLTVESVLNDERTIHVKLDLYAPEGVVLPYGDNRCFETIAVYNHNGEPINYGWSMGETIDEDKTDNHVEILITIDINENVDTSFLLNDRGVTLELTNLYKIYGLFFSRKTETMAEGIWQFNLRFATTQENLWEYELISEPVACVVPRFDEGEDVEIYLTSAYLRSLSMNLEYDFPATEEKGMLKWWGVKAVKLDGTEVMMSPKANDLIYEETGIKGYAAFDAEAPIILEEIAYIEFPGGIQIQVNVEQ